MAELIAEWAGKERLFRLNYGGVLDLEEACSDAIGAIFLRVSTGRYGAADIWQTLRLALIGGGLDKVEAKHLLERHFDTYPLAENAAVAGDVLVALMVGVEDFGESAEGEPARMKFSEVSQICRTFHMSPQDLRAMSYADFINMVSGFNAASGEKLEPITEEEFDEILARYEPEALK